MKKFYTLIAKLFVTIIIFPFILLVLLFEKPIFSVIGRIFEKWVEKDIVKSIKKQRASKKEKKMQKRAHNKSEEPISYPHAGH